MISTTYFTNEPLRIGTRKQLLLDDTMVEDRFGLKRRVKTPLKYGNTPVLSADKVWENGLVFAPTVRFDEDEQLYKMWYSTFHAGAYYKSGKSGNGAKYYMCYAESEDGFNWVKPQFSLIPFGRHRQTNIVFRGVDSSAGNFVFRDPNERDPARKYKMIYTDRGMRLACSPDGIHWTPVGEDPILATHSDCNNHVVYDEDRGLWKLYMRPIVFSSGVREGGGKRHMRRRVALAESADLLHWSKPRCIIVPDELDATDIDSISVFRYESKYIGLMSNFDHNEENREQQGQMMRIELAFSDNGYEWRKHPEKPIFIDHGPEGSFDAKMVYMTGAGPVELFDNELAFYYTGSNWNGYDLDVRSMGIGIARLRQDGFVEQAAEGEGGYLVTREFILEGNELEINCTRNLREAAAIRVEIAEYPGQPMAGYSFQDCDPISTNDTARIVSWNGSSRLDALRGKPVYIRFHLIHSGLYSFKINQRGD